MFAKIKLFCQIRQFYNIFGEYVGENFITKLSEMTKDNVNDVIFDINEALEMYDDHRDDMARWLRKLIRSIRSYHEPKPLKLSDIFCTICAVMMIWGVVSTIDVSLTDPLLGEKHSPWNLWAILFVEDAESSQYTAYGRYYVDGTVITDDGNEWSYSADTISDQTPTNAMPVWVGFDDNATPNDITDDIILGLVYDRETAIYDDLEEALADEFELERDGNNIKIGGMK